MVRSVRNERKIIYTQITTEVDMTYEEFCAIAAKVIMWIFAMLITFAICYAYWNTFPKEDKPGCLITEMPVGG